MSKSRLPYFVIPLLLALACVPPALAENEGRAVGVDPDARAEGNGERTLVVGADVSVGERIVTGPSGQVQLIFVDDTRLVVGPGSALLIEQYLLRGGNSAERVVINALGGTFRFISGNSPSTAYQLNTPSATIGVRGTAFDLTVASNQTFVLLYDGSVQLCSTGDNCVDLIQRCAIGVADPANAALYLHADSARLEAVQVFRYARVQSPLMAEFRVNGAGQCYPTRTDGGAQSIFTNDDEDQRPPPDDDPRQTPNQPTPRP